jgi:hypothetical protein
MVASFADHQAVRHPISGRRAEMKPPSFRHSGMVR